MGKPAHARVNTSPNRQLAARHTFNSRVVVAFAMFGAVLLLTGFLIIGTGNALNLSEIFNDIFHDTLALKDTPAQEETSAGAEGAADTGTQAPDSSNDTENPGSSAEAGTATATDAPNTEDGLDVLSQKADYSVYISLALALIQNDIFKEQYYTEESWEEFSEAREEFEQVERGLTANYQDTIDQASQRLQEAISELTLKDLLDSSTYETIVQNLSSLIAQYQTYMEALSKVTELEARIDTLEAEYKSSLEEQEKAAAAAAEAQKAAYEAQIAALTADQKNEIEALNIAFAEERAEAEKAYAAEREAAQETYTANLKTAEKEYKAALKVLKSESKAEKQNLTEELESYRSTITWLWIVVVVLAVIIIALLISAIVLVKKASTSPHYGNHANLA